MLRIDGPHACEDSERIIPLADGDADVFIAHPQSGGSWPTILFYMDAPGIRSELHQMARRLASNGFTVILPNLFYRAGINARLGRDAAIPGTAEQDRMFSLMNSITVADVMADTEALLEVLEAHDYADTSRMGALGYCMSGRYAMAALNKWPGRVRAAASIYGTDLVTGKPDSPHLLGAQVTGRLYVVIAEKDPFAPASEAPILEAEFQKGPVDAELEIVAGVDHGFCFPERETYDDGCAEAVWGKLVKLFTESLV